MRFWTQSPFFCFSLFVCFCSCVYVPILRLYFLLFFSLQEYTIMVLSILTKLYRFYPGRARNIRTKNFSVSPTNWRISKLLWYSHCSKHFIEFVLNPDFINQRLNSVFLQVLFLFSGGNLMFSHASSVFALGPGADQLEHATPILSLCHGIFTDWSIFSTPFLL